MSWFELALHKVQWRDDTEGIFKWLCIKPNGVMILKAFLHLTEINIKLSDGFVVFWSHMALARPAEDGTSVRRKH
jgi:hypothetical protein